MSEPGIIRLEQHIDRSPAKVWKALTDPALIAKWWAPGDIRPVVGHTFTLDMGQPFGKQTCKVLTVEPEREISYAFSPGMLTTTITWRLKPDATGTLVTLEHKGFDLDAPMGKAAFNGMGGGWPKILARIGTTL